MTDRPCMPKAEMEKGLAEGFSLIQEEYCNPAEIRFVDELICEGKATATDWKYKDNFQCEMRHVYGIKN